MNLLHAVFNGIFISMDICLSKVILNRRWIWVASDCFRCKFDYSSRL